MNIMKELSNIGIIPVVVIDDVEKALPLGKALKDGGIPCAEITFRTNAAEESIKIMVKNCPELLVGAGTVLNVETAKRAIDAGAKFIVSPGFNIDLVKWCIENIIPCIPGCSNPSEMTMAYNFGLKVVKFFPAENLGGINFINACGSALPLKFIPTGGINLKNLSDYAVSNKIFAVGGTWMVKKDLIENKQWDEISKLCRAGIRTLLGFNIKHVGINLKSKDESYKIAKLLSNTFDITLEEKSVSYFAGTMFETMNAIERGTNGHIAIGTNDVDKAMYHMKNWGIKFDETTKKIDELSGRTKFVYLNDEIGGFAIHLVLN